MHAPIQCHLSHHLIWYAHFIIAKNNNICGPVVYVFVCYSYTWGIATHAIAIYTRMIKN